MNFFHSFFKDLLIIQEQKKIQVDSDVRSFTFALVKKRIKKLFTERTLVRGQLWNLYGIENFNKNL